VWGGLNMGNRNDTIDLLVEKIGRSEEEIVIALNESDSLIKDDGIIYSTTVEGKEVPGNTKEFVEYLEIYFSDKPVLKNEPTDEPTSEESNPNNDFDNTAWFIPEEQTSGQPGEQANFNESADSEKKNDDTVYEAAVVVDNEKQETTVLPNVPPNLPEQKSEPVEQKSEELTGIPEDVNGPGGYEKMKEDKSNGKMKYGLVGFLLGATISLFGTNAYIEYHGEKSFVPVEGNPAYVQVVKENESLTRRNNQLSTSNEGLGLQLGKAKETIATGGEALDKKSLSLIACQIKNNDCKTDYATCEDDNSANIGSTLTCLGEVDYLWGELGSCADGLADCDALAAFKKGTLDECLQSYRTCNQNLIDAKNNNDDNASYKKQFETASDDLASCESKLKIARETTCPTKTCPAPEIIEKEVYKEKECQPKDCVKYNCAFLRD
jgi:hypothetical protein